MYKVFQRITHSERGEKFNPLTWPFLIATFAYGLGFVAFFHTEGVGASSLFVSMMTLNPAIPYIWGAAAVLTIIIGVTFLAFHIPPAGKISGLIGFMLWVYAGFCWGTTGAWLPLFSVAVPNMWFWVWQYLSLSLFRHEDDQDIATMKSYNAGEYDDVENPIDAKKARENNRGLDDEGPFEQDSFVLDPSRLPPVWPSDTDQ
jgi:hypothetical protein